MHQPPEKAERPNRRPNAATALTRACRESWDVDDDLRRLTVEQARTTLESSEANARDRQNAAAFVLKLCEFNLNRALLMAEIDSLLGGEESPVSIRNNKHFFGNDAHETFESADQESSDSEDESAGD